MINLVLKLNLKNQKYENKKNIIWNDVGFILF